jgi:hypothetical protein
MCPPLPHVAHVALLLQGAEHREYGGVGEVVGEAPADLGDGGRAQVPQHAHDIELAVGESDLHGVLSY